MESKEKIMKAGWITAIGVIVIYFATTTMLWFNGVRTLDVNIAILMLLVFVYPIMFFFLGIYIVLKKKIFPLQK